MMARAYLRWISGAFLARVPVPDTSFHGTIGPGRYRVLSFRDGSNLRSPVYFENGQVVGYGPLGLVNS